MRAFNKDLIPRPRNNDSFTLPKVKLDVEIGCGVGLHSILWAKSNDESDRFLVAIEHTKEKFNKFKNRYINNNSPKNLLPIHANAISWITHNLKKQQVDRYYFLYPNPNPKPGDLNKRFHAMPFMSYVIETLKVDGEIILATNEIFYANEAKKFFQEVWKLELFSQETLNKEHISSARTHFEKKYLERGQECFNLVFKKKQ